MDELKHSFSRPLKISEERERPIKSEEQELGLTLMQKGALAVHMLLPLEVTNLLHKVVYEDGSQDDCEQADASEDKTVHRVLSALAWGVICKERKTSTSDSYLRLSRYSMSDVCHMTISSSTSGTMALLFDVLALLETTGTFSRTSN